MSILVEKYNINTNKIKKNIKISLITDIHYMNNKYNEINNNIIKELNTLKPNYIVLGGDYFGGNGQFTFKNNMKPLKDLLKEISKIAPVILSLGNHDLSIKDDKELRKEFKKLKNKNIYPLDNDSIEFKDIKFSGFFASRNSYAISKISDKKANIIIEDFNKSNLSISKDKYNVLIHHLPDTIFNKKIRDNLKEIYKYDLILSGHAHNGWYSPKKERSIEEAINKEIDKNKKHILELKRYSGFCESIINDIPFVRNICRGMHNIDGTKIIVSRGITTGLTWALGNKVIMHTNKEYSYITEVTIEGKNETK